MVPESCTALDTVAQEASALAHKDNDENGDDDGNHNRDEHNNHDDDYILYNENHNDSDDNDHDHDDDDKRRRRRRNTSRSRRRRRRRIRRRRGRRRRRRRTVTTKTKAIITIMKETMSECFMTRQWTLLDLNYVNKTSAEEGCFWTTRINIIVAHGNTASNGYVQLGFCERSEQIKISLISLITVCIWFPAFATIMTIIEAKIWLQITSTRLPYDLLVEAT